MYINKVKTFYYFLIIHDLKLIHKFHLSKNKCNLPTGNFSHYNPSERK